MEREDKKNEHIENINDETPDNFTRFGDGHKPKIESNYTDGEPPDEDAVPDAEPNRNQEEDNKPLYP